MLGMDAEPECRHQNEDFLASTLKRFLALYELEVDDLCPAIG